MAIERREETRDGTSYRQVLFEFDASLNALQLLPILRQRQWGELRIWDSREPGSYDSSDTCNCEVLPIYLVHRAIALP